MNLRMDGWVDCLKIGGGITWWGESGEWREIGKGERWGDRGEGGCVVN